MWQLWRVSPLLVIYDNVKPNINQKVEPSSTTSCLDDLGHTGLPLWVSFVWKMGARSVATPYHVVGGHSEMMG